MTLRQNLREEVKKATREYIESVAQDTAGEIPTETIRTVGDGPLSMVQAKEIDRPSKAIQNNLFKYRTGGFEPIAQKIVDHLEVNHVPEVDIDEDGMMATGPSNTEREFERALMEFAGIVMDYVGEFTFDEKAFSVAYDQNFYPEFTDRERITVLIPISQVVTDTTVSLTDDFELESKYFHPYTICNIEISPINDLEQNGIATFDEDFNTTVTPRIATEYEASQKLKFEIYRRPSYREFQENCRFGEGPPDKLESEEITVMPMERLTGHIHRELIQEMIETTKRVIHLDSPRCNPGFQSAYVSAPKFLQYRGIAIDIVDKHPIDSEGNRGTVTLTGDKVSDFESFWDRYVNLVSADEGSFSRPLTRFEEMFRKPRKEDQLLDCLIALEKTLLTDTSQASSYTFRMGLRAGILLAESERNPNWDRDKVYEFFRELYEIRGQIVHNDVSIQDILNKEDDFVLDEFNSTNPFIDQTRVLLANIILRYMDQRINHNIGIHETNKAIDSAARHADYIPERDSN